MYYISELNINANLTIKKLDCHIKGYKARIYAYNNSLESWISVMVSQDKIEFLVCINKSDMTHSILQLIQFKKY